MFLIWMSREGAGCASLVQLVLLKEFTCCLASGFACYVACLPWACWFRFSASQKNKNIYFQCWTLGTTLPPPEEGGWGGVKPTKGYVNDFGQEGQFFQKVVAMLNQKSSAKHWGEPAHFSGESVRAVW